MSSCRCCSHRLPLWHVVSLLPCLVASILPISCDTECTGAFLGSSAVNHTVTTDWPYGDGSAAGAWKLTLVPNTYGTNCVTVTDNQYPSESYTYTLEFADADAAGIAGVYVDGVLFARGDYVDADGDAIDTLSYETGERTEEARAGGAIRYIIDGAADLEANRRAGTLTWTGYEEIRVVESEDPEIKAGCVFYYDVTGIKVCDE